MAGMEQLEIHSKVCDSDWGGRKTLTKAELYRALG